jgi:hypothetical protein
MKKSTRLIVQTACAADTSITSEQINSAICALDGHVIPTQAEAKPLDRVLTRQQVAELLNVTPTSVSNYAKRGLIRRVAFGARGIRSNGYAESSVRELLQKKEA